ncbi:ATP-binding protein [Streptomyces tanashiensis]|uniref:ATP-binding protein n=1 Tax=Streptomyces tanashiensis TaxID=67367 RepID=A0ABY6RAV8_9ACTN|nr:ATP-binding protein [Streptomyces tanashiensis]UZX26427.1 ATP-binding protein [Streptomyces tanashiensis]
MTRPSPAGAPRGTVETPRRELAPAPSRTRRLLAVSAVAAAPCSVPLLRRLARSVARRQRLSEAAEEALTVIVTELATNVVLHSGSPDLAVMFEADDSFVTVSVRDGGRWQPRSAPRCEDADMDASFGRGLALVEAYATATSVRGSAEGTLVRATIAL